MGHPPPATPVARGLGRDARLRRRAIRVSTENADRVLLVDAVSPPKVPASCFRTRRCQICRRKSRVQNPNKGSCVYSYLKPTAPPLNQNPELIHSYLNGPRTLSNQRISYLILSTSDSMPTPPISPMPSSSTLDDGQPENEFNLLICAAHFLGDGMALHQFAHEFFTLLGSQDSVRDLEEALNKEWIERWGPQTVTSDIIPCSIEESMPQFAGRFRRAAAAVDFKSSQDKLIGGQSFPRASAKERRTIVPTVSFDEDRTKAMLKACKAHGVSISAALFALCNIVWVRMHPDGGELPM